MGLTNSMPQEEVSALVPHALESKEDIGPATRRWPCWVDALNAKDQCFEEGGIRTRGKLKTGSADYPLVSYITVVRNNVGTIARTIESVQAQTYPNVEHIILDGASTDGTLNVIRSYVEKLDYFASESDGGLYEALNKAIPLARGELICILNSDDWLEPGAAQIAASSIDKFGEPTLLLSAASVVKNDEMIQHWDPAVVHPGCYFTCANDCHNAIYATKSAYEHSGPYDASYKIAGDFKWIMTCLDAGLRFAYTREVTVNYSLGGASGDALNHSLECMQVVTDRFPDLSAAEIGGLYHCFFMFAKVAEPSRRPVDAMMFLRDVCTRHSSESSLIVAMGWAAMATLKHPADIESLPVVVTKKSVRSAFKAAVKDRLSSHPAALAFVKSAYLRLKGR